MPKIISIIPKKYLPKKESLPIAVINFERLSSGEVRATIKAPPASASNFNASVHAPKTVTMFVSRLGKCPNRKNNKNTSASNKDENFTHLPMAINTPVITRKAPIRYTSTPKFSVASGGTGKITGLNPGYKKCKTPIPAIPKP